MKRVRPAGSEPLVRLGVVVDVGRYELLDLLVREVGLLDGESFEETDLPDEEIEELAATDVDYDTKPDEWL